MQSRPHESRGHECHGGAPRDVAARRRALALAGEALAARGGLVLLAVALFVFLTVPLAMILVRSVEGRDGEFVGVANFVQYVQSRRRWRSRRSTRSCSRC